MVETRGESVLAVSRRPRCINCEKVLKPCYKYFWGFGTARAEYKELYGYGYLGNNKFCSLRCGFYWAVKKA